MTPLRKAVKLNLKIMSKKTTAATAAESKINSPEYDGVETWQEQISLNQPPVTKTQKVNMSSTEVKKFLGDLDPNLYFRGGKVPVWFKEYGTIVDPEDEESIVLKGIMTNMPELVLFKHKTQPLYNVLVPKPLSEYELNSEGDIVDVVHHADMRAIAFGGTNAPKSYEKTYFKMRAEVIHKNLLRRMERMKEWRAHQESLIN